MSKGYQGLPTGDLVREDEPIQPGHFETPDKPNHCLCCGEEYWYFQGAPGCICRYTPRWMQDELRRVTCEMHLAEKFKDGLFGALPGGFRVNDRKIVDTPAREGRVAPIVHK